MRNVFAPEVRVLACEGCGAPLEGAAGAMDLSCSYCGATNRIAMPDAVASKPALSAEEQRGRLLQQAERTRELSPTVADFVDGSRLAPCRAVAPSSPQSWRRAR